MLAGMFTNVVFGLVRASVMLAAVRTTAGFGGYDADSIGAYVWFSQGLLGALALMGPPPDIVERIRNGDVAIDFLRPLDIQFSYLATDLGRAACTLLVRGVPSVAAGMLTMQIGLPHETCPYVLGAVSVVLAVTISALLLFSVGLVGFWLVETRGLRLLYQIVATFLAGLFVPVHLFPDWLYTIAMLTPFPALLQGPIDVLSGRATGVAVAQILCIQIFWVAVALLLGRLLLRAGRRKLEVQGG
ncbi:ABC-2 family transporter protein [Nocardia sp. CDC159]|uniref:ABC-2 family transporter protein n=2 Tax=Nocardia pulmonis TaxID=2951408 RepID=A0A9X2ECB5_9NOCA|nr:ABC-2 family transporter protein [Nocardia sp. CDC159]MCM6777725.1 ABC-2 family transporter protein [Nocardia pulmonis]MCM6790471.1 ABC-2 family transporter protein [Nocardia sp. CDC159]